jgi:hypothetical protein
MLPMTRGGSARPRLGVVTAQKMQKVRRLQSDGSICKALRIHQQRKCDPGLLAKERGVAHIAKTDRSEIGALGPELLLMVAQLRNMLAAEDSTVMAEEDDNGGAAFPQRAEPDFALIRVRKRDIGERAAKRFSHRRNLTRSSWNQQKKRLHTICGACRKSTRFLYPQIGRFIHKSRLSELRTRRPPHYDRRSNDEAGSETAT